MDSCSIHRTDLESPTTQQSSPDPVLESYFRQKLQQLFPDPSQGLAANDGTEVDKICGGTIEQTLGDKEEKYAFRLFTRPSASGPASVGTSKDPRQITIRSPSPAGGDLTLTCRGRPENYYFTGDTSPELAEQYVQAAVSGQDIIEGFQMRWKGMELGWRVTIIKTTESGKVVGSEDQSQAQMNRRKRIGKKRRILNRRKFEARATKKEVARQNLAEKEAAEREKRTRKNREKKVKKRQKDKLKKMNGTQDPA